VAKEEPAPSSNNRGRSTNLTAFRAARYPGGGWRHVKCGIHRVRWEQASRHGVRIRTPYVGASRLSRGRHAELVAASRRPWERLGLRSFAPAAAAAAASCGLTTTGPRRSRKLLNWSHRWVATAFQWRWTISTSAKSSV